MEDRIVDGVFDVQVDTEGTEGIVELEAFRVADGQLGRTTIMSGTLPLAFVSIDAEGFSHEGFIETTETDRITALPAHVRDAYALVVDIATNGETRRFKRGENVWITEHRMEGLVVSYTTDGRYRVEMGGTEVADSFADDELKVLDRELIEQ